MKYGWIEKASEIVKPMLDHKFEHRITRLQLRETVKKMSATLEAFVEERNALVQEYGEDGQISPESPRWDEFVAQYEALMNAEVEVEWGPLPEVVLDAFPLSANDEEILTLSGLIQDADETA